MAGACCAPLPLEVPSPRLRGEGGAKRRVRGATRQELGRVAPLIRRFAAPSPRKRGEGPPPPGPLPACCIDGDRALQGRSPVCWRGCWKGPCCLRGEGGAKRRVR